METLLEMFTMHFSVSEYNREQWIGLTAIRDAVQQMQEEELQALRASLSPYLEFRSSLAAFHARFFHEICRKSCYETALSACCGFESIITFFADQLINGLLMERAELDRLVECLEKPNGTGKCVFLGTQGCRWRLPPISCAMFYCDQIKSAVFAENPEAATRLEQFRLLERRFTHPDQAVLFDDLERHFRRKGLQTPQMYYHSSPGLLRLKAKAGILDESLRIRK